VSKQPRLNWFVRWFFRTPMPFYRYFPGFERIYGSQWILLTTKGRRTGKPRPVLLDLVGHDHSTNRYYVQPGWGRECQWVRNIEADPFVEAQIGRKHFRARVIDVSGPEGGAYVHAFARKHPIETAFVSWLIPGMAAPKGTEAELTEWYSKHILVFAVVPIAEEGGAKGKDAQ
jgi:deazaflavin-dependent oxidoreductase (nitroreductase family)